MNVFSQGCSSVSLCQIDVYLHFLNVENVRHFFGKKKFKKKSGIFFWPGARGVWLDIGSAGVFPYNLNVGYCLDYGVVSVCKKNQTFLYNFSRYEILTKKSKNCPVKGKKMRSGFEIAHFFMPLTLKK
jgi:hypothetical protein